MTKPLIHILTGPSGVGKGTLCRLLLQQRPDLRLSISATTRPMRPGEQDGVSYHFRTRADFEEMIAHDRQAPDARKHQLLEWAEYNGHYYGTPRAAVEACLAKGERVLLEIEVCGALQVKERFPDSQLIFIAPPDLETLRQRLRQRGSDAEAVIEQRLKIAEREMALCDRFDVVLINDSLDDCLQRLVILFASTLPKPQKSPI